jgi:peptidoglycan/xylan/chitin deacetylase (PgdA/CDA1 family)
MSWGPNGSRAAVSFTFDNLGEAADIETGRWPADKAIGRHYTVEDVLPALIKRFVDQKVTFFVEGWNAETYPSILKELHQRGHDVSLHGWRHELWADQQADQHRSILERSLNAFTQIGLRPAGFRPPGGNVPENPSSLLHEFGFEYYSASDKSFGIKAGVAQIPFAWQNLDGVYLMPGGAAMAGLSSLPQPSTPDGMKVAFQNAIDQAVEAGIHLALVFHPWLLGQDRERMRVLFEIYDYAVSRNDVWVAPCRDVAAWILHDAPTRPSQRLTAQR